MVYFVAFVLSTVSLSLFDRIKLRIGDNVRKTITGEIIAIVLFTLLTFARAYSVGTDTINYYYSAESVGNSSGSILSILNGYYIEPGYGLLEYFTMNVFGDVHFLFLIEGLLLIAGVMSFIHNFEGKLSYPLAFAVFFCFYFNSSLNISRQYLALAIGFFSARCLLRNKVISFFLLCLLATAMHSSGAMLFVSYFIWKYLYLGKTNSRFIKKLAVLVTFVIVACIMIQPISSSLARIGLIPFKYASMLQGGGDSASSAVLAIVANSPLLILLCLYWKKLLKHDERNCFVISMYLLGFFVSLLNSVYGNVGRLALFWSSWQIILFPECCELVCVKQKTALSRVLIKSLFYSFFIAYWIYSVPVRGFGGTCPYVSDIVPWLNW